MSNGSWSCVMGAEGNAHRVLRLLQVARSLAFWAVAAVCVAIVLPEIASSQVIIGEVAVVHKRCMTKTQSDSYDCLPIGPNNNSQYQFSVTDWSIAEQVSLFLGPTQEWQWYAPGNPISKNQPTAYDKMVWVTNSICPNGGYDVWFGSYGDVCVTGGLMAWQTTTNTLGAWTFQFVMDGVVKNQTLLQSMPTTVVKISGDNQTVPIGKSLQPLVVTLNDFAGQAVKDGSRIQPVTFAVSGSGGSVYSSGLPDASGQISADVALTGTGTYTVTATSLDSSPQSVTFTLTVTPPQPPPNDVADEQGNGSGGDTQNVGTAGGMPCSGSKPPEFAGDPINLTNGNNVQVETDYVRTGLSPIEFTRTYNSLGSKSALMNNYWTTTYDRFVIPASGTQPLKLRRQNGVSIRFTPGPGGTYLSDPFFHGTLQQSGSGWRYTDADGTIEDYNSSGKLTTITDLHGRVQTLSYNSGRLTKVAANTGESLSFQYNSNSQVSGVTDQAGRVWSYLYDGYANLTQATLPDKTVRYYQHTDPNSPYLLTHIYDYDSTDVHWEYDAQGRATANYFGDPSAPLQRIDLDYNADGTRTVMDGSGSASLYDVTSVNGRGFVTSKAGPGYSTCGNDLSRTFDSAKNVLSTTQLGHTKQFGNYDTKGQNGVEIGGYGTPSQRETDFIYDSRFYNKPTQITEPSVVPGKSKVTTFTYDAYGNPTQKTVSGFQPAIGTSPVVAVSRTWKYTYSGPYHQLTLVDAPRTDVTDITSIAYDSAGRVSTVTDANGIATRKKITYTATGHIAAEDRPDGLHLAYAYYAGNDLLQTVTETQGTQARVTTWTYDKSRRVTRIDFTDNSPSGWGWSATIRYDAAGRVTGAWLGDSGVSYTLDGRGNPIAESTTGADGGTLDLQRTFDAYNRVNKVIGANNTIEYDFQPDGALMQTKDGKGQSTKRQYDDLLRLAKVIRPDASQISLGYDTASNLTQVTDPNAATTNYVYDDFGNKIAQISPDTGITLFSYDLARNLVQVIDAKSQVTKYTYDAGNRLRSVDRAGTDYDETYTYDNCTNGTGRLCSMTNGVGETIAYTYDGLGRVASVTTQGKNISYQYDPIDRVVQITYPSGRVINYLPGYNSNIVKVTATENGNVTTLADNIKHGPLREPTSWTYGNGLVHTRQYDGQEWPQSIVTPGVSSLSYNQYDANGNLQSLTVDGANDAFGYDTFDELNYASGDFGTRNYVYDAVGNRTNLTANGLTTNYSYAPKSNRLASQTGWSYTLDANGNTLQKLAADGSGTGWSYSYSPHNRLTAVYDLRAPTVPKAAYRYNALGQRVAKSVNGIETKYRYGLDGNLLAETDAAGNVLQEYVYLEGLPLALLGKPAPAAPPQTYDQIVDNGAVPAGTDWTVAKSTAALNGSYLLISSKSKQSAGPANQYQWQLSVPVDGYYDVSITWMWAKTDKLPTTVSYSISTDTTLVGLPVSTSGHAQGDWVKVGNTFLPAGSVYVTAPWRLPNAYGDPLYAWTADASRVTLTQPAAQSPKYQYIHTDHLGAPRAITNCSGIVIWKATYDPFGLAAIEDDVANTGQHTTLNLRFPGQYADAESSLHHNYFRDYDPSTGRYLENDPLGLAGGVNSYSYGDRNPLTRTDKYGLCVEDLCIGEALFLLALYSEEITIGGIIGAEIVAGVPNPVSTPVSFGGRIAGEAIHDVYLGMRNGEAVYVGITKDVVCRAAQHGQRFDELVKVTEVPVLRDQARAIEQVIKNQNPQFENIINSIAPTRSWYDEAVEWGSAWLEERGY